MVKRLLLLVLALVVVGGAGFVAFAWRPAMAPRDPGRTLSFPAGQIARGAVLAGAGYCAVCHTVRGGGDYAGGYAMKTGFGTIYSTNITPDDATGIGTWTEAAFARAMRQGVDREGAHLLPAFPYTHFTELSDDDIAALYAFFMTRKPVHAPAHPNGMPFPLNVRLLQAGWKLLFFTPGRFVADPAHDAEWNRGAYLAEGLSHCSACHTPRNLLGGERSDAHFGGADVDAWIAPPLDSSNPTPAQWTTDELIAYLGHGVTALHGSAAGPMAPAVHGLDVLPPSDLRAIAVYVASFTGPPRPGAQAAIDKAMARSGTDLGGGTQDPDARLYASACGACHYNSGKMPLPDRPELGLNNALTLAEPTNLYQVMLNGIDAPDGIAGVAMPAFAQALTNADMARIAGYLRRTRTDLPPWTDLEKKAAAVRESDAP